jgi:5-methylthioadenosine/S-adenosylhomocysteine deaminase
MDPQLGDFARADVLVEGKKILAVGPSLQAGDATEIDAAGRIVMPGFIDTHHHQFETALRGFLADGVLINDGSGSPSGSTTYYEYISPQVRTRVPSAGRVYQRVVRGA